MPGVVFAEQLNEPAAERHPMRAKPRVPPNAFVVGFTEKGVVICQQSCFETKLRKRHAFLDLTVTDRSCITGCVRIGHIENIAGELAVRFLTVKEESYLRGRNLCVTGRKLRPADGIVHMFEPDAGVGIGNEKKRILSECTSFGGS